MVLCCEICFLYCDDVRLGVVYQVFKFLDFVSDAVYADLKYAVVFVLWLIVVCEWLGGDLYAMGWCVICASCCCYDFCVCVCVCMVHLQSGLYCRSFICVQFR